MELRLGLGLGEGWVWVRSPAPYLAMAPSAAASTLRIFEPVSLYMASAISKSSAAAAYAPSSMRALLG